MRYIRTTNNYVEFIEADDNRNILSTRGFQFGELYFQIKNGKVTFYLNDQENPWRNDVWTINIPLEIDGEVYATEDEASSALHHIMNDTFQEQLDQLSEDLAAESARAEQAEEDLGEEIDDERDRATSAETHIQTEVTELSGLVSTFDNRISDVEDAVSALTDNLTNEIARSTGKDAEHDAQISGLTNTLNSEIQRALSAETTLTSTLNDEIARSTAKDASQDAEISGLTTSLQNEINRSVGAENSLRSDLNSEISARTSADASQLQRITALEVGKADANSVYTKTESDNKYATKDYISGLTDNFYTKGQTNELLAAKADKVSAVASAIYNSTNKTIDFKNISGTVISSIDARDFIKDGMVDNVEIVGNNLVITFNTDAGKEAITVSLASIFDPTNYYNKAEIDAALSGKASTGDVATISGDVQTISGDVQTLSGEVQTISGSAITSGEVQTLIDNSISGKTIDYLSAGTNVQINNNVISATDTKYTAGSGITISGADNKITFNLPIYKGSGSLSVSVNNIQGTTGSANNIAGDTSFGAGFDVRTSNVFEATFGTANNNVGTSSYSTGFNGSSGNTLFTIGNGTSSTRHNALEIRQNGDIYIADTNGSGTYYQKPMIKLQDAIGGGSGVTSGEVQTMIDNSVSGKADTSAVTASLLEKVNVIDNEIPDYYTTVDYEGYFPASGTSASTWNDMITSAKIRVIPPYECMTQPYNVHISDENGFVASGNVWSNFSALSPYATVTTESEGAPYYSTWYVITPNEGYRISYIEAKHCDDGTLRPIQLKIPQILYNGGQSADVIQNEIEPELVRLNDAIDSIPTYSAGTNVQINNGVISATDTTYSAGDGISISNSNVISTVTKFWCGTEQEWGQISGGTLDVNTIYMVH